MSFLKNRFWLKWLKYTEFPFRKGEYQKGRDKILWDKEARRYRRISNPGFPKYLVAPSSAQSVNRVEPSRAASFVDSFNSTCLSVKWQSTIASIMTDTFEEIVRKALPSSSEAKAFCRKVTRAVFDNKLYAHVDKSWQVHSRREPSFVTLRLGRFRFDSSTRLRVWLSDRRSPVSRVAYAREPAPTNNRSIMSEHFLASSVPLSIHTELM